MAAVIKGRLGPAEAQRAFYIDFEGLKKPPAPALLGVLGPDDEFEQLILDPRLTAARKANRRSRVVEPATGIEELLDRADGDDRLIVGWSFFDRDTAIALAPHLEDRLRARYRNAIQIARPWRQAIHPSVTIARDDDFAAKHTLDKYARLAGYPHAGALDKATPAKWIRQALRQLGAKKVRFGRISKAARDNWRKLLEYNRHDCLALRHITQKAAAELQSWRAFEKTLFCVADDRREVCFTAGSKSTRLQTLLARHDATRWAFMTGWNPAPQTLSRAENDRRQRQLTTELDARGYRSLHGVGRAADGSWEEESLLVVNISKTAAIAVARRYGQLAIVVGAKDEPAQLVSCAVPGA